MGLCPDPSGGSDHPYRGDPHGLVNPENIATTYYFQWGTTVSYGKTTKAVTLPAGITNKLVKGKIGSLNTETTYHYRIVAENSTGVTYGYDETVTTLHAEPPYAVTEPASGLEETTATLNGTINPKKLATKYHFEWGPTTAYASHSKEASAGKGTSNILESLPSPASNPPPNTTTASPQAAPAATNSASTGSSKHTDGPRWRASAARSKT